MERNPVDTHLVNGLLDAGKTTHITQTITRDFFHRRERGTTLIIACEEGETEYDAALLRAYRTQVVCPGDAVRESASAVEELLARYAPDRVFWEANAMWGAPALPACLRRVSSTVLIHGGTLDVCYRNMRQIFTDMLRGAELVIFNRAPDCAALQPYARPFRLTNARAGYLWESPLGYHERAFGITLPFDLSEPRLEIEGEAFALWYLDALEHPEHYAGKHLSMTVQAQPRAALPGGFLAGRQVMTCCLADIQFLGFPCSSDGGLKLANRAWVRLEATGRVVRGASGEACLLLETRRIAPVAPPKDAMIM